MSEHIFINKDKLERLIREDKRYEKKTKLTGLLIIITLWLLNFSIIYFGINTFLKTKVVVFLIIFQLMLSFILYKIYKY